jgi:hypothetical protein
MANIVLCDTFLAICGISNAGPVATRQSTTFIATQGFQSIDDFIGLTQTDIGRLVKSYNDGTPAQRLGFMVEKNLQALAHWATDRARRQLPLDPAGWSPEALKHAKSSMAIAEEMKANPEKPKKVEKITTGIGWYNWQQRFENYLSQVRGVGNVPLLYVIRRDKPDGWDPATDAKNETECLIYQVAPEGHEYEADNKTVYNKLLDLTLGEAAYEWIRKFETTQDGRAAMIQLRKHCEGEDFTTRRINEANRTLKEVHYNNEYSFSFENYSTKLLSAYTVLERHGNMFPDMMKVYRLVDKMNVPNNMLFTHAKAKVKEDFSDNWDGAVNYLGTVINEIFPPKEEGIGGKSKGRFVYEANVRGRGGRGRHGRDGHGGRGRSRGGGRLPAEVNGIDISDIHRSFTASEWQALGPDMRSKVIRARQDDARGRGRGRGRSDSRGRTISAANSYKYVRSHDTDDHDGDSKLEEPASTTSTLSSSTKGGQAGRVFGRGMYTENSK